LFPEDYRRIRTDNEQVAPGRWRLRKALPGFRYCHPDDIVTGHFGRQDTFIYIRRCHAEFDTNLRQQFAASWRR
jgi:hypothetical protein